MRAARSCLLWSAGALLTAACAGETSRRAVADPSPATSAAAADLVAPTRVVYEKKIDSSCELVVPFYEGLRFSPVAAALRSVKSEVLDLAYPGALSMPMMAWRCKGEPWTAVTTTAPESTPASLVVRLEGDDVSVRLECFGACAFRRVEADGDWQKMAHELAHRMNVHANSPPLASRYSKMDFFVRSWVSADADPALRTDWSEVALLARMRSEPSTSMSFVFGLDPNEVDLQGHYFWSEGAKSEMQAIFKANASAAQFHWLNLRSYKTEIPRLGITREPPPDIVDAEKKTGGSVAFEQYVFKATEMCLGAQTWQTSRVKEMQKLLDLGFKVIAFDEFPAARTWSAEPCKATNHLHRPDDFADEQRVALDLVRKLSDMAHAKGALVSSEEPSLALLPFTSGYMDGAFDDPADMYEHWEDGQGIEKIPLFSTMFGAELTPYTRPAKSHHAPSSWIVQEQISGSP